MKKLLLFIFPFLIFLPLSYAQTFTVNTYGVSPRQVANDSVAHYFDRRYTGLQNVGNQSKVYLEVTNSAAKLNAPVWSFTSVPFGSGVTFGAVNNIDTSDQIITFIPDKVGTYIVNVTDGSLSASITINSSLYVGIHNGACYICHNGAFLPVGVPLYSKWTGTLHAVATKNGLDGLNSSHFNATCLQCHTTGYDTLAQNNGFDDYPFVFPDTLMPGMYDSLSQVYPDAMALANVQCEACHGPGNNHYGDTTNARMVKSLDAQVCAYCHDSGTHYYLPTQFYASVHANPTYLEYQYQAGEVACARCHSGSGFVAYIEGGKQELTAAPTPHKMACAVCHDPHDATNSYQLRTETATLANGVAISGIGEGALCMNCHQARVEAVSYTNDYLNNLSHYGPHHGPQGDMIAGTNGYTFGMSLPSSPHMEVASGCIACHMASASVNTDGTVQLFGSHSLNMVDPKTGNDNVAACAPCHGTTVGTKFSDKLFYVNGNADLDGNGVAQGLQIEMQGLLNEVARLLPPLGDTTVVVDSTYTLLQAEAAYNWDFVSEDRSLGIHNPEYAYSLLAVTLQKLNPTTGIKLINNTIPQTYSLDQNFPNPFNPTTNIKYAIPKEGNVKLQIFDITGRLVTTLVNKSMSPGTYTITWNGRNSNGQSVGSGIYLYRLQTDGFVSAKKMVMLK